MFLYLFLASQLRFTDFSSTNRLMLAGGTARHSARGITFLIYDHLYVSDVQLGTRGKKALFSKKLKNYKCVNVKVSEYGINDIQAMWLQV